MGLARLADAAVRASDRPSLEATLDGVLELMVPEASEDDVALLALVLRG